MNQIAAPNASDLPKTHAHALPPTSRHVIQNPRAPSIASGIAELYGLQEDEERWRDRYSFLLDRGLELRHRYRPGWAPSWLNTNLDPATCEDYIEATHYVVLDARRLEDGAVVCIKRITPIITDDNTSTSGEVQIARYLSTEQMLHNQTNHCVPIWDDFRDPAIPGVEYIVMPVLRPYNDPEFGFVGEVVDFVTQLLEGLNFMHGHLVAHEDLTSQNIMVDARPILPQGWHFFRHDLAPNGIDSIASLARIDHPVRYFIIDYDCAIRFHPNESHLLEGFDGREGDPPELKQNQQYDAFKVDVFTLGHVFDKDFYQVYEGVEFLKNQVDIMQTPDFRQRPTAQVTLQRWLEIKGKLDITTARWRLRKRDESMGLRVMRGAVSVVQQGLGGVTRMLNPQQRARVRTWSNP